jgi:UDPglucose 6-dehydrogenase
MQEAQRIYGERSDLVLAADPEASLQGADCLAIVTEWQIFRAPDFGQLAQSLRDRMIFDGRNLYDPALVAGYGLGYVSIGRQPVPRGE